MLALRLGLPHHESSTLHSFPLPGKHSLSMTHWGLQSTALHYIAIMDRFFYFQIDGIFPSAIPKSPILTFLSPPSSKT